MRKSAPLFCALLLSLSARRAWIEMLLWVPKKNRPSVALRKESVDRNTTLLVFYAFSKMSLSARRAWIEIFWEVIKMLLRDVALRKESVDRNFDIRYTTSTRPRSLSARRAWIEIHRDATLRL